MSESTSPRKSVHRLCAASITVMMMILMIICGDNVLPKLQPSCLTRDAAIVRTPQAPYVASWVHETTHRQSSLADGLPCAQAGICASGKCTKKCCGTTFRNVNGTCQRAKFAFEPCGSNEDCISHTCTNGGACSLPASKLGRALSIAASELAGIAFNLTNYPGQGFRFVTRVNGVPVILDSGSSSLIFCNLCRCVFL